MDKEINEMFRFTMKLNFTNKSYGELINLIISILKDLLWSSNWLVMSS